MGHGLETLQEFIHQLNIKHPIIKVNRVNAFHIRYNFLNLMIYITKDNSIPDCSSKPAAR